MAAYLQTEIVRIHAEQATLGEDAGFDAASPLRSHLEGELAAVQKTLAMVSDDAFAEVERQAAASDDRLRPGTPGAGAEGDTSSGRPL